MKQLVEFELMRIYRGHIRITLFLNNFGYLEKQIYDNRTGETMTEAKKINFFQGLKAI